MADMLDTTNPIQWLAVLAPFTAVLPILYILYQSILPKPIPGIPYSKHAAKSIFGDIPDMKRELPGNLLSWIGQDILLRRKELDRSSFMSNVLSGEAKFFYIILKTGLVAAPNIYKSALCLLDLWKRKAYLAEGRAFSAENDVFYAALDAVLDFGFGDAAPMRALIPQVELLASMSAANGMAEQSSAHYTDVLEFPTASIDPGLEATLQSAENVGGVAMTGFPKLAWSVIGLRPSVRRGRAVRDDFLVDQVLQASDRFKTQLRDVDNEDKHVKSAIDLMVRRLNSVMEKEGHLLPDWIETMRAEHNPLLGHQFIADDQAVQQRLFESIQSFHTAASSEGRLPTHAEICDANIPYLDAVIEEMLRLAHTATSQDRECREDTVILGHVIPRGTTVIVPNQGPSFTEPGYEIEERLRSPSSRKAAADFGSRVWDSHEMGRFEPDRWLVRDEKGNDEYNASAGPTLPFGLGLRGCFGRKLAYMEMKLLITLLIWSFEFQKCPENLSSYESITSLTRKPVQCYVRLKVR
ncbi:cytochrome P450 [Colletotrichum scovillei]|uniref:cytochrome P450 n=1 Tax=Colletotrichum scovillei TaxID=1209932 RepID=UPI0015C3EDC2|nr:cytochrome P450 [Colletotrichum scovillei]KAF4784850.1 cytochrome P450 [Colletotrichum scovillei]